MIHFEMIERKIILLLCSAILANKKRHWQKNSHLGINQKLFYFKCLYFCIEWIVILFRLKGDNSISLINTMQLCMKYFKMNVLNYHCFYRNTLLYKSLQGFFLSIFAYVSPNFILSWNAYMYITACKFCFVNICF